MKYLGVWAHLFGCFFSMFIRGCEQFFPKTNRFDCEQSSSTCTTQKHISSKPEGARNHDASPIGRGRRRRRRRRRRRHQRPMPIVPRVKPKFSSSSSSSNASFFSRLFFFFFSPQRTQQIVWKSLGQKRRLLLLILATFFLHREFLASCGPHSKYGFLETRACHKNASAKEDWKTSKFGFDFLLNRPQRGGKNVSSRKRTKKRAGFVCAMGIK